MRLLIVAGALLFGAPAFAQQRPQPAPELPTAPVPATSPTPADGATSAAVPLPARDTVPPRDTVKAPIAVAERPRSPDLSGRRIVWDRDAIFASGAFTLPELLALVPGASTFNAAFIAAPTATSWYGQPGRVRVYMDGLELDPLDPRTQGTMDLSTIQLWAMEEVAVERAPGELRVHLRTWRVRLTTPQTRTDVVTGAENTNLYRGFYGKRFDSGAVLQIAAQQFSTTNFLVRGDGDGLGAFMRVGVARERWTADFVASRNGRTRTATKRYVLAGSAQPVDNAAVPGFRGRDVVAYLRAAYRTPEEEGVWAQFLAGTVQYVEDDSAASSAATPDADTVAVQTQWVGTIGLTRGALRLSGTGRLRAQGGESRFAPSVRASWERRWYSLSAFAELNGPDSTTRLDVLGRAEVFPWLHVAGGFSQHAPDAVIGGPSRSSSRAEMALGWKARWLTLGVVQRGEGLVQGMPLFDKAFEGQTLEAATGLELGVRAPIAGPLVFEFRGIDWGGEALYRSSLESHAELRVASGFKKRLPRANFMMVAAVTHDYRNDFLAPDGSGGVMRARGASVLGTQLDLRIGAAHVFWYNRNLTGKVYETIPGYLMPRLVQLYGIRWEFWN